MSAEKVASRPRPRMSSADLVEEVDWLTSFGMDPDRIAQALGMRRKSVERAMPRAGHLDLAQKIWTVAA